MSNKSWDGRVHLASLNTTNDAEPPLAILIARDNVKEEEFNTQEFNVLRIRYTYFIHLISSPTPRLSVSKKVSFLVMNNAYSDNVCYLSVGAF